MNLRKVFGLASSQEVSELRNRYETLMNSINYIHTELDRLEQLIPIKKKKKGDIK
jgi:hypothetical protein